MARFELLDVDVFRFVFMGRIVGFESNLLDLDRGTVLLVTIANGEPGLEMSFQCGEHGVCFFGDLLPGTTDAPQQVRELP